MRSLIMSALMVFSSMAFAFEDRAVQDETSRLSAYLTQEASIKRREEAVENFKNFLAQHLQNVIVVNTQSGREEFRSLNEFQATINAINTSRKKKNHCSQERALLVSQHQLNRLDEVSSAPILSEEAELALSLFDHMCPSTVADE